MSSVDDSAPRKSSRKGALLAPARVKGGDVPRILRCSMMPRQRTMPLLEAVVEAVVAIGAEPPTIAVQGRQFLI